MEITYAIISVIIAITSIAWYVIRDRMTYWKKRGIPADEPAFLYGNLKGVPLKRHYREPFRALYNKYKGQSPFFGLYSYLLPVVVPTDLDLIRKILVKDFANFTDRGMYYNEKDDPLSGHLFNLDGSKWRQLRTKLTPTFTSGKMKYMFSTILEVGHRFAEVFSEIVGKGAVIDMKEVLARFTIDLIGICAFGIECNSLQDPKAEFRLRGPKSGLRRNHPVVNALARTFPDIARRLHIRVLQDDVHNFFMRIVRETVEYRESHGIVRNDFMNLMIELKNKKTDNGEKITNLTMDELAAQAFVFYVAGYEPSATTMGLALYEMAQNHEVQDKLRREVHEVLEKHGGLNYESLSAMKYMDQVMFETMRKYPSLPGLHRRAKEEYIIEGTKYKIEKGAHICIPVYPIHYDPDIYPNPDDFDPERFNAAEAAKRDSIAWLPFGDGPRNCIGLRFAKMIVRIGLSVLLKNFKFEVCQQTEIPLEYNPKIFNLDTKRGVYLKVSPV